MSSFSTHEPGRPYGRPGPGGPPADQPGTTGGQPGVGLPADPSRTAQRDESDAGERGDGPVIRDRRRLDPQTGQLRQPTQPDARSGQPAGAPRQAADLDAFEAEIAADVSGADALLADVDRLRDEAAERTDDLRRLQAEYVNYRRRVERDRDAVRDLAVSAALAELLPVLDDIGRAREHGDLTGGFKSVAEALEATVTRLGLVRFGEPGEPFDPMRHEALMHSYSGEVDRPTAVQVLVPGYRFGERVIRPARVAVAEPEQ